MEAFRDAVESALRARDWSLSQLGRETRIQPSVISRWLNPTSVSRPSPRNLAKLAPVFGIPYENLMRMCGYLPGAADRQIDPDLAAVNAAWPALDAGLRRAVKILIAAAPGFRADPSRESDGSRDYIYQTAGHLYRARYRSQPVLARV